MKIDDPVALPKKISVTLSVTLNIVSDLMSVTTARMDIWQFSTIGILVLFLYLLYCLILLPLAGILFIRPEMQFQKNPAAILKR